VLGPDDNPYIVNELPSVTNDSALDGVIGTVIFFDLDTNDTHHVVTSEAPIAVNSVLPFAIPTKTLADLDGALIAAVAEDSTHATPGQVEWLFRIPDSDLDFLGGGQSFAVTYDISVTDSQDSTSTQPITITFNGADDSPVALADSNAVGYGKSLHVNINHGVLSNDIDPDISDQGHLTVLAVDGSTTNVGHAVHGKYGWLILDANGSYSYIAEREPDFHKHHDHHVRHKHLDQRYESDGYNHHEHQHDQIHFSSSAVLQDVFTYTTSDGQGETSTATLSIVISDPDAAYQSGSHITLIGHHLKNVLDGSSGGDILIGASGSDVLIGGAGDKLSGGKGSDIFLFRPKFGTETITDFNVQQDSIQFDKSLFSSANDILNHSTNINDGVVIADAFGDKLTLVGVTTGLLHLHKGDLHLS